MRCVFDTLIIDMDSQDNLPIHLSKRTWRDKIVPKLSKLPGIQELHAFMVVKHPDTGVAGMEVRQHFLMVQFVLHL